MFKSKLAAAVLAAAMAIVPAVSLVPSAQAASGFDARCILPNGSVDYQEVFLGGEAFVVQVVGSGETDLDLFVYDENGNLIASDTRYGDDCSAIVLPYVTQVMTIRVVNHGSTHNCYTITVI